MHKYFITGIGTEIGKTITSAILVEKLKADYWKPIQSGDLNHSDSMKVKEWISNPKSEIHTERYRLNYPMSPHISAAKDGIHIQLQDFKLPETNNHLIVEGAGGLYVPINHHETILDLIQQLQLEVILVSRNYLGSINHTILSIEALKHRGIIIKGIIFNGKKQESSESFILQNYNIPLIGHIPMLENIDQKAIIDAGKSLNL